MKSPFTSKTMWFNLLALLVGAVDQYQSIIPDKYLPIAGVVLAVGNMILRLFTVEAVGLPPAKQR